GPKKTGLSSSFSSFATFKSSESLWRIATSVSRRVPRSCGPELPTPMRYSFEAPGRTWMVPPETYVFGVVIARTTPNTVPMKTQVKTIHFRLRRVRRFSARALPSSFVTQPPPVWNDRGLNSSWGAALVSIGLMPGRTAHSFLRLAVACRCLWNLGVRTAFGKRFAGCSLLSTAGPGPPLPCSYNPPRARSETLDCALPYLSNVQQAVTERSQCWRIQNTWR